MQAETFDAHLGRLVTIDICHACQSFWFDPHESATLTPGSTLSLFRIIGEKISRPQRSNADLAKCPRCKAGCAARHTANHEFGI
jgi:Zn-finger nucleic acid-binding protein